MTMGDELLLLAVGTGKRHPRIRSDDRLRIALRTAELAELALAGRIDFGSRTIEILDSGPVEDRRLNNVLSELVRTVPTPTLHDWVRATPPSLTTAYLSRLQDQKAVKARRWRDAVGHTRHDILSVDVRRRRTVLDRLDAVVRSGPEAPAAPYDHALAVLVQVADVASAVYPGVRGASARRRLAARTVATGTALGVPAQDAASSAAAGADVPTVHIYLPGGKLGKQLVKLYRDIAEGDHGGQGADLVSGVGGSSDDGGGGGGSSGGGND
ncbi:GPP34 family phosphoprotein [Streptomyces sp. NPDC051561]|uniref:GOLPH3/VPS74 family protein n=1 Tax=Streptomyces sp. NPDC051561 TaxID=3365658 RepID=UPI0037916DCE